MVLAELPEQRRHVALYQTASQGFTALHLCGVGLHEDDGARLAGRDLLQVGQRVRRARPRVPLHAGASKGPPQLPVHVLLLALR